MCALDLSTPRHPMRVVVNRTGLGPSLLRAWERRHGAVIPERSTAGHRRYSEADIRRLLLLRDLVAAGHGIGGVAGLPDDKLRVLRQRGGRGGKPWADPARHLDETVAAVLDLDARTLGRQLVRAALALRPGDLVDGVVVPLLGKIGDLWADGAANPGTEHLATAEVTRFLGWFLGTLVAKEGAPGLVTGTPSGHRHELGALLAAVGGAAAGWAPVHLGPDLPAAEIARVARRTGARAVALSALFPVPDAGLLPELRALRRELPERVGLFVGGPAVVACGPIGIPGVDAPGDLAAFRERLEELWNGGRND